MGGEMGGLGEDGEGGAGNSNEPTADGGGGSGRCMGGRRAGLQMQIHTPAMAPRRGRIITEGRRSKQAAQEEPVACVEVLTTAPKRGRAWQFQD